MPTVFLPMCADIIHTGHIKILNTAGEEGTVTVMLMTDDAMRSYKREPTMAYEQRREILLAMNVVTTVIPCEGPSFYESIVAKHRPDVFVHGDDWKTGPQSTARSQVVEIMATYGGKVIEPQYTPGVSSSQLQDDMDVTLAGQRKLGVLLRTALNDLKRTPEVVSRETGLGVNVINTILNGQEFDAQNIASVTSLLAHCYPVDKKTPPGEPRHQLEWSLAQK